MSDHKKEITEWDAKEQREETSIQTLSQFLRGFVANYWPLVAAAVVFVGVTVWFYYHP
jgi:hypothetical protein